MDRATSFKVKEKSGNFFLVRENFEENSRKMEIEGFCAKRA